jgi:hypothetical protein
MNRDVIVPQIRAYLLAHINDHSAHFLMRSHPFEIDAWDLTQQLVGLKKAQKKFPFLFENKEVVYPPKVNLEQTSSEITATYKAHLIKGKTMLDLTGGWGIDVSAFAKAGFQSTHIELSVDLQPYAQQLFKAQELQVLSVQGDGLNYVFNNVDHADVIYIDPSRKTASSSKAVRLEDYEPNVLKNLDLLMQKCEVLMVKTSPMLDLHLGMEQLKYVAQIHIVAVKNEVKELLWLLRNDVKKVAVICTNLDTHQPQLKFDFHTDQNGTQFCEPRSYLYEPNAAIMKSKGFQTLSNRFAVVKLDQNSHLFTSNQLIDFPGRVFKVVQVHAYKPKIIKKRFGKSARGIVTRNFKNTVKQLRDKYLFSEHDTDYLFFTHVNGVGAVVIEASKIV